MQPCLPDSPEWDSLTKVTDSTVAGNMTLPNVLEWVSSAHYCQLWGRPLQCVQLREVGPRTATQTNNAGGCGAGRRLEG